MKKKQRADLRIVVAVDGQTGLVWQATLDGDHLYAGGVKESEHEIFRFSYHADGKTHFYTGGSRIVTTRQPKLTEIKGLHQGPTWNPYAIDKGYAAKPDSPHRRTLVLRRDRPPGSPFVVDLWFVGPEFDGPPTAQILEQKAYTNRGVDVMGTVTADWTQPQIVAVAWGFEADAWARIKEQIVPEAGSAPQGSSYVWVDRTGYRSDPAGGFESIKLPDPDTVDPRGPKGK